jgi:hypothetical protein
LAVDILIDNFTNCLVERNTDTIVETAPHNYGHNGKYIGVGGHMFAIACQCS